MRVIEKLLLTVGGLLADCWRTVGGLLTDCWRTVGCPDFVAVIFAFVPGVNYGPLYLTHGIINSRTNSIVTRPRGLLGRHAISIIGGVQH